MPKSAKSAKSAKLLKSDQPAQPNILVIWGDDIGISNLGCYSHGVMGYQTPNIDVARCRHDAVPQRKKHELGRRVSHPAARTLAWQDRGRGTDPFEFAEITSNTYGDWWINNGAIALAAQAVVAKFVETFKEFPPIQKPNTFTVDDALAKMSEAASS